MSWLTLSRCTFLAAGLLLSCGAPDSASQYQAEIRRTSFGVPHILATDLGSVAFGQGYAYAEDRGCVLSDQILKIKSGRAEVFGRGDGDIEIDTDFAYLSLDLYQRARQALAVQSRESHELLAGYAAGFNALLKSGHSLSTDCQGASWVKPISELDLMAHLLDIALVGAPRVLLPNIGRARPPAASNEQAFTPRAAALSLDLPASNGWAVGSARTSSGQSILVGNPHFPWEGDLELYENQLQVVNGLDVYGATIGGIPGMLIGFNRHVAWTHTVSAATQTMLYSLQLASGNPTSYRYADGYREMTRQTYEVDFLDSQGETRTERRTLYFSHYGPILDAPGIGWSAERTSALKTTALSDFSVVSQYLAYASATDTQSLLAAQTTYQGSQWANTLAIDDQGRALYSDSARVPLLTDGASEAYTRFKEHDLFAALYAASNVMLVDGSDPVFEWRDDGVGPDKDVSPFALAPQLERSDYLFNSNESYWLSQPDQPLESRLTSEGESVPFSFLYGPIRTARSPRTRKNAALLSDRSKDGPAGDDGLWDIAELKSAVLDDRSLMAEELLPALLARCEREATTDVAGETISLAEACSALDSWDGRFDPKAGSGALVFRQFLGEFNDADLREAGRLFAEPFDPERPISTPGSLAPPVKTGVDPVMRALGRAIVKLRSLGGPLSRLNLSDAQHTLVGSALVPVHGCQEREGCLNVVRYSDQFNTSIARGVTPGAIVDAQTGLAEDGYWINHGTSFVFIVELGAQGPHAEALLTYGQGGEADLPHYRDQLELFEQQRLRPVLFEEADILADPMLTRTCLKTASDGRATTACP